jgi:hypothetical protein
VRQTISSPILPKRGPISKQSRGKRTDEGEADPKLRDVLERASSGLVYSSESDRPFEFFALEYCGNPASPAAAQGASPGASEGESPGAAEFARLAGASPDAPVEVRSLKSFFARHTTTSDPYDTQAQLIRPRYEELVRQIENHLRDVRVYRIGRIEIACYIAGLERQGNLAGLKTVAIET